MNEIVSFKPDESLSPYISGYFYSTYHFDGFGNQFFTPKGTAAMMIPLEINPSSYLTYPDKSTKIYFEKFVPHLFGQMSKMGISYLKDIFNLFVIVFKPTGLFHFLEGPASLMTDRVMRLDQLGVTELHHNLKKLFESNTEIEICLEHVNRFLIVHFNKIPRKKSTQYLHAVINDIHKKRGVVDLDDIVEKLGINNRTFQMHFKKEVGISPKLFCRITRFNSLLQALDSVPDTDILSFAIQFGYTDNPHLYKDFKQFLGMTPKKYLQLIDNVNALVEKEAKRFIPK